MQRNSKYCTRTEAFHVPAALEFFGNHLRAKHDDYLELAGHAKRAWELASGSWNRPAWTDTLARNEQLDPDDLAWIEGYIGRVCRYVKAWPA